LAPVVQHSIWLLSSSSAADVLLLLLLRLTAAW
jgi:hypothetical protein